MDWPYQSRNLFILTTQAIFEGCILFVYCVHTTVSVFFLIHAMYENVNDIQSVHLWQLTRRKHCVQRLTCIRLKFRITDKNEMPQRLFGCVFATCKCRAAGLCKCIIFLEIIVDIFSINVRYALFLDKLWTCWTEWTWISQHFLYTPSSMLNIFLWITCT